MDPGQQFGGYATSDWDEFGSDAVRALPMHSAQFLAAFCAFALARAAAGDSEQGTLLLDAARAWADSTDLSLVAPGQSLDYSTLGEPELETYGDIYRFHAECSLAYVHQLIREFSNDAAYWAVDHLYQAATEAATARVGYISVESGSESEVDLLQEIYTMSFVVGTVEFLRDAIDMVRGLDAESATLVGARQSLTDSLSRWISGLPPRTAKLR